MSSVVLDASALLALLQQEPGAEVVAVALKNSCVSTVNWSEVLQKALASHIDTVDMQANFEALGVEFVPFSSHHSELASNLWLKTKPFGLSFGDRACLALALDRQAIALTADSVWTKLQLSVQVQVIRP
ncbi:MAG: type II toxin-antitoxin system VapC family toxin [Thermosynechococcaceae cyanobacterium MS004]|nr:type II toxin-antitoxin system VapC family toxin [Thermosynechococcaceae cyanobacterium MS004]